MAFIDYFKDFANNRLKKTLRHFEEDLFEMIELGARRASRYVMRELLGIVFIASAVIFLCIAATFFFIEYLTVSRTVAFLIMGIVLLLVGVIVKLR